MNSLGLSSIRYEGIEYLAAGEVRPRGDLAALGAESTITINRSANRVGQIFSWGSILSEYRASGNHLNIKITIHNKSPHALRNVWFEPLQLRFPDKVFEYDGNTPLLTDSLGRPALLRVSSNAGVVVLASEDLAKPVQLGFPWALDRPENTIFPLSINTGRVESFPGGCPTIRRAILPGGSDSFELSLRFGPPGSTVEALAGDIYQEYASRTPSRLHWDDRRAIGALFLSTAAAGWSKNPRGWLQDPKVDITTPSGIAALRSRILQYADASISILRYMNAQGMITWDIEGQEYPHAISYIGDPRLFDLLSPEMRDIANDYFARFRDAGLRVGVCIRPQMVEIAADGVRQLPSANPLELLKEKAAWAKRRWGATLFYVDSNVNPDDLNPLDASIFEQLAAAFPDSFFIPEHATPQYYAYTAPYRELRQRHARTDPEIWNLYPGAFSVIYTADGPLGDRYLDLAAGVERGDILLFRAWFNDPQNEIVRRIYRDARPATDGAGRPGAAIKLK